MRKTEAVVVIPNVALHLLTTGSFLVNSSCSGLVLTYLLTYLQVVSSIQQDDATVATAVAACTKCVPMMSLIIGVVGHTASAL